MLEYFYGHCMLRVLHKLRHPKFRILLIKIDLDAAYRRLHVKAAIALLTITIIEKLAYVLLHLPFGVANGSNDYSLVSEPLFDLTMIYYRTVHSSRKHCIHPSGRNLRNQKQIR